MDPKNKNFRVGHNKFSTWTDDEFKRLLGNKEVENYTAPMSELEVPESLPESIDWRTKGAVNPVKDQGHCGSCWAFAATAAIESHHFLYSGELLNLAEQQFVDCDPQSDGCDGGYAMWAFDYAHTHFQELQGDYPYTAQTGTCNYNHDLGKVKVKEHYLVKPQSIEDLKVAIFHGPVGVSVEADKPVFRQYTSGVLDSDECGIATNHAIVAVGYGKTDDG
jgi:cathepsin L